MSTIPNPESAYFCSSCQFHLQEEKEYKLHYKSEFHRYNIKRKLLEFAPVTYDQFMKRKISIKFRANILLFTTFFYIIQKFLIAKTQIQAKLPHINAIFASFL